MYVHICVCIYVLHYGHKKKPTKKQKQKKL